MRSNGFQESGGEPTCLTRTKKKTKKRSVMTGTIKRGGREEKVQLKQKEEKEWTKRKGHESRKNWPDCKIQTRHREEVKI